MKDSRAMSSVQALDDYFDALLEEGNSLLQDHTDVALQAVDHAIDEETTLAPQPVVVEPVEQFSGATLTEDKRDLSSVEKLLSQLKLDEDMEIEVEILTETDVSTDSKLAVDVDTEVLTEVEAEVTQEVVTDTTVDTDVFTEPDLEIAVEETVTEEVTGSVDIATETECEADVQTDEDTAPPWQNIAPEYAFQVLFFESFGVVYAVPLAELGGIHRLKECNHLIGRPDWYLGLQTERDQQLDVVDTAKWVMPEKITDNSHREDYSYIVTLGNSKWGLACNALLGTESLSGEQVRWREQAGKRPWLAGLVKEKMCALIHVEALIAMLNQGIDANALA